MYFRFSIGRELPKCPEHMGAINSYLSFPSVAIIFSLFAIISFVFSLVIGVKYNSVRVFNKKVRFPFK
jgi:hypothetical protein